ncbi:Hypothetical protein PHPALM_712 [Phytophthora palmivora]|uniref:CCHC-type domain-containing protein n=1 Tax=Phytophthora palmivora TaxID=4796 RepID=A0A2P4YU60_9STRA|nr:Hypothetical protein PHPALM_712 [Phytophthora palmivora]
MPSKPAHSPDHMKTFVNAAMERFLRATGSAPALERTDAGGTRDGDMESVESPRCKQEEYDPDDLSIDMPRQAVVASAGMSSGSPASAATGAPRIRVSAISELKEFLGKDNDEDRARSCLGKAKSAFREMPSLRRSAHRSGEELVPTTKPIHTKQLEKKLLGSFQTKYCVRGVSVARQYYHTRKRSVESPLEYLHRLNVAGMRAKLQIKDGPGAMRREHVEHFIEKLDDRELADQLACCILEETLSARQRAKARQGRAHTGSNKFRQKVGPAPQSAPSKTARAVRIVHTAEGSSESESESSGSEPEDEYRQVYLVASTDREQRGDLRSPHQGDNRPTERPSTSMTQSRCTHCGSSKHDDLGCWKRLTCQKCGRKGHPSDHCLFVCRACGEIHDAGKCPMKEFYNLIRKWYVPTKHAGMLPVDAEKMLN